MFKTKLFITALGALFILPAAAADEPASLFKDNGIEVGGWINAGITYNANNPANRFNGPVTFADRSKEFQLNQLNVFMQRAVATEGKAWDFGGRFDVMFGTDAIFTQAYGIPSFDVNTGQPLKRSSWDLKLCCSSSRFYNMALPQAYIETYVPIGNGLNLKIGHFYSPTGYETVPAPDNFFYTRAYTFSNGEPFTHTGLLGNYTANKNWSFMGGAITGSATGGWDGGWDKEMSNWGGLAGVTWTSDDKISSANLTGSYSRTSTRSNEPWGFYIKSHQKRSWFCTKLVVSRAVLSCLTVIRMWHGMESTCSCIMTSGRICRWASVVNGSVIKTDSVSARQSESLKQPMVYTLALRPISWLPVNPPIIMMSP
jgi:hypothetical protein